LITKQARKQTQGNYKNTTEIKLNQPSAGRVFDMPKVKVAETRKWSADTEKKNWTHCRWVAGGGGN